MPVLFDSSAALVGNQGSSLLPGDLGVDQIHVGPDDHGINVEKAARLARGEVTHF